MHFLDLPNEIILMIMDMLDLNGMLSLHSALPAMRHLTRPRLCKLDFLCVNVRRDAMIESSRRKLKVADLPRISKFGKCETLMLRIGKKVIFTKALVEYVKTIPQGMRIVIECDQNLDSSVSFARFVISLDRAVVVLFLNNGVFKCCTINFSGEFSVRWIGKAKEMCKACPEDNFNYFVHRTLQ